jgi:hypothetical protein
MQESINLLVNGCSFSRGPDSWPYHLDGVNVTNLACAGAGNTYIHDTTISELSQRSYDFVAIMWSGVDRFDIKVDDIDLMDTTYTSKYQSSRNDWKGKVIFPVNDQDYVEKDWLFGCGEINNDTFIKNKKLFTPIYYLQNRKQFVHRSLIYFISLQNTLKQLNTPYLFMFYQDYEKELAQTYPHLYNMLDHSRIYNSENIYSITKRNVWYDADGFHPGVAAHQQWATLIQDLIK